MSHELPAKRVGSADAAVPPKKRPRRPETETEEAEFSEATVAPLDLSASACRRESPTLLSCQEPSLTSDGWLGRWHSLYARQLYLSSLGLLLPEQRHSQRPLTDWTSRPTDACRKPRETVKTVKAAASPTPSSGETDFLCSCGRSFVSLIEFTLHLKDTGHVPVSAYRDKDIPKLVRGQDMWINSETEQTKEILRCIRCRQSFRTLPDLTMHMVRTKHYAEIIYSDRLASSSKDRRFERQDVKDSKEAVVKDADSVAKDAESVVKVADDAASAGSPGGSSTAEQLTCTLQKMQNFVESSLPKTPPGVFQQVLRASAFDCERDGEARDSAAGGCCSSSSSSSSSFYLSPDRPACAENPLSSLQKLVETAEQPAVPCTSRSDSRDAADSRNDSRDASDASPSPPALSHFPFHSPPAACGRVPPSPVRQESATPIDLTRTAMGASRIVKEISNDSGDKSWQESSLQKKAKCQFCCKPFANKGQVRLHVSKGKCPSLLSRLQSAVASPLAVSPFAYFGGFDYLKAASQLRAAGLLTAEQLLRAYNKELQA